MPELLETAWERRADTTRSIKPRVEQLRVLAEQNFEILEKKLAEPRKSDGLLTGSAVLLLSTTVVNAGNYVFNLLLGRWLGPGAFAELSLMVTLLLVVSFVTSTFGMLTARFAANYTADGDFDRLSGLRHWLGGRAWLVGGAVGLALILGSPFLSAFFATQSVWPFIILGAGFPIYIVQSIDRGILQGQTRFKVLAASYQAEMWTRLIAGVAFVAIGWSVNGAVGGLTMSFLAAWVIARKAGKQLPKSGTMPASERSAVWKYAGLVNLALVSQIMINNSDILIVKHFFAADLAGQYAALALIGRVVFFATWSVTTVLFPIVAQRHRRGEAHRHLLGFAIVGVGSLSALMVGSAFLFPDLMVKALFGEAYLSIAPLLWVYAGATSLYSLSNLLINYRLSMGNGTGSMLALGAGVAQVVGLWLFHDGMLQVVLVQVVIMTVLLAALLGLELWLTQQQKLVLSKA